MERPSANPREARTDWRLSPRSQHDAGGSPTPSGRTHQIRVHFSALKHPVVGDALYGAASKLCVGKTTCRPWDAIFCIAAKLALGSPGPAHGSKFARWLPVELREYLKKLCDAAGERRAE